MPNDFTVTLNNGRTAQILVITDGSETNTANYVQSYASGVIYQWLETTGYSKQQGSLIDPQLRICSGIRRSLPAIILFCPVLWP